MVNSGGQLQRRYGPWWGSISLAWLAIMVSIWPALAASETPFLKHVMYPTAGDQQPFKMNMTTMSEIAITLLFDKDLIREQKVERLEVLFKTRTISPQFNILSLDVESSRVILDKRTLDSRNYAPVVKLKLFANYIGHAILEPVAIEYTDNTKGPMKSQPLINRGINSMPITIVQFEGVWGTIFIVSVSVLMLISYINLGAQLDMDNMREIIKKPKTLILGFLISAFVMPLFSWFVGQWLLSGQQLYRMGMYVFACCPAASASTLWTVMLHSDKELSVGLQVVSTFGALATMPGLLYLMDRSLSSELSYHSIKIPYGRLVGTLFTLLVALILGWRLIGQNERAQKISQKLFRPLVFFVLIFIIVFSSILYWHIYQMFDWSITLATAIITFSTYLISGLLGHLINCDLDRGVAIAISSAYKNSGIAFAVLLVAFETPDTYIAYVPCLTQIVLTSLSLYLAYCVVGLVGCLRRRGQPAPIQAQVNAAEEGRSSGGRVIKEITGSGGSGGGGGGGGESLVGSPKARAAKSGSFGDKSTNGGDENDEFIAMNVTDLDAPADGPPSTSAAEAQSKPAPPPPKQTTTSAANDDDDDD